MGIGREDITGLPVEHVPQDFSSKGCRGSARYRAADSGSGIARGRSDGAPAASFFRLGRYQSRYMVLLRVA